MANHQQKARIMHFDSKASLKIGNGGKRLSGIIYGYATGCLLHSKKSDSVQVKVAVDSGTELYELFYKLDATNESTFKSSFDSIKGQMEAIFAKYNSKPLNMADICKYRNEINSYFGSTLKFV